MENLELFKLLKDRKVADAFQFYTSCQYKLSMAEISHVALSNLINQYNEDNTRDIQETFNKAITVGQGRLTPKKQMVDFFGTEIEISVAIDKLTMEIMGLLHNFFDTFSQWINFSLFGEKAIEIGRVSLKNVAKHLKEFPEYSGEFITFLLKLKETEEYNYIADFNNIQKHRYQIHVKNKFDILKVQGEVSIPEFNKDGENREKKMVFETMNGYIEFCKNTLNNSRVYVEDYYSSHECNYVQSRYYNPNTFLYFESKEDAMKNKNCLNHYYYLEVDSSNINKEYQIMLAYDRLHIEEGGLVLYNSPYEIIMLKEKENNSIIGILKVCDTESIRLGDEHYLRYRKYTVKMEDYKNEMFNVIGSKEFSYYPFLTEISCAYPIEHHNEN